jgi:hypothetical protein
LIGKLLAVTGGGVAIVVLGSVTCLLTDVPRQAS